MVYSGYGQAEDSQNVPVQPQQTASTRYDAIPVIGLGLAFFSTLVIFTATLAQGSR